MRCRQRVGYGPTLETRHSPRSWVVPLLGLTPGTSDLRLTWTHSSSCHHALSLLWPLLPSTLAWPLAQPCSRKAPRAHLGILLNLPYLSWAINSSRSPLRGCSPPTSHTPMAPFSLPDQNFQSPPTPKSNFRLPPNLQASHIGPCATVQCFLGALDTPSFPVAFIGPCVAWLCSPRHSPTMLNLTSALLPCLGSLPLSVLCPKTDRPSLCSAGLLFLIL